MSPEELTLFAARLAALRDEDLNHAGNETDDGIRAFYRGRAQAFALASDMLHVRSRGEFGEEFNTQPTSCAEVVER